MTNEIHKQYDRLDDVSSIMLRMKVVYAVPDRHIRYAATKAFFGTKMAKGSSATTYKSATVVLVGEASTSRAKGKRAGRWKRKKGKGKVVVATASVESVPAGPKGKGKGKREDICGLLNTLARGGYSYFITFTDDHSWYGYVYLMRYKSKAFGESKEYRLKGYALETAAKLLNMVPFKTESSETPQHNDETSFEPSVPTDDVPVLYRSTRESRPPERYGFVGLTSQLDNDSRTYGEAMLDIDSDKWLEAMKSKMDSMSSNQVWTLLDPSKGVRPVGCKWVYKCKLVVDGDVTTFKARLVAKGYTQQPRVDFEETYSPVAMTKSIRIMLAIAAWSICDLKQASQSWNTCFDEVIWGYDFIKNEHDPCVYKNISGSSVAYLVLYADDILLIEDDLKMLGDIKAWLSTKFFMMVMGEATL
ncbi:Copia protein [Sesamum angolense]|uniref:Copia protein n=1 Tax=Sesamum angolense TaxID=2727404 RepID=A0AAE2BM17_9LAMI|nr:Copia protein [Sesamum angolense]